MNCLKTLSLLVVVGLMASLAHACEPPDCDRKDCGTCANSCCNLEYFLDADPVSLNTMLASLMTVGGPDQHYTFVATEDLRPYHIEAYFILQGIHTTFKMKYNDTLNFVISPTNSSIKYQSRLTAFSISQIHGAYCDDGQNYKNLAQLIKGLNIDYIERTVAGCKPPEKSDSFDDVKPLPEKELVKRAVKRVGEMKRINIV